LDGRQSMASRLIDQVIHRCASLAAYLAVALCQEFAECTRHCLHSGLLSLKARKTQTELGVR